MDGKEKCRMLKRIRAEIARQNDIDLVIEECPHKGDCLGTCPRCEADVRFLEEELEKRRKKGLAVKLAGIASDVIDGVASALTENPLARAIRRKRYPNAGYIPPEGMMPLEGDVRIPGEETLLRPVRTDDDRARPPLAVPDEPRRISDDDPNAVLKQTLSEIEAKLPRRGEDD